MIIMWVISKRPIGTIPLIRIMEKLWWFIQSTGILVRENKLPYIFCNINKINGLCVDAFDCHLIHIIAENPDKNYDNLRIKTIFFFGRKSNGRYRLHIISRNLAMIKVKQAYNSLTVKHCLALNQSNRDALKLNFDFISSDSKRHRDLSEKKNEMKWISFHPTVVYLIPMFFMLFNHVKKHAYITSW